MTKNQLEDLIIASIADEVIRRIQSKLLTLQKHALVVCTGSTIALPVWIDQLRELKQSGFTFDLFLSYSANQILDKEMLKERIGFEKVWQFTTDKMPEEIAAEYTTVIVPAMTVTTASKVSHCIADTPAARIILTAMMKAKNVVIVTDGCCPDNKERAEKGYAMTEPMKHYLRENNRALKDFGATLSVAKKLASRTMKAIGQTFTSKDTFKSAGFKINKKIITRQDLSDFSNSTVVEVPKNSQITELAADLIRERGIQIVRK